MRNVPNIVHGGANLYGHTVGVLMMEAAFPRLPGAIGNATTFSFPVLYKVVPGGTGEKVVRTASKIIDPERLRSEVSAPWIAAAQELEREGARAITSSCGFTAIFQRELAASVSVPVFASSLLLAPFLASMLPQARRVGIITADASNMNERHFEGVSIDPSRIAVAGLEHSAHFQDMVRNNRHEVDVERFRAEVIDVVASLLRKNPDVAIILLECSLLPPFAVDVQKATGLPVYDFTSMINMVHAGLIRRGFDGYL